MRRFSRSLTFFEASEENLGFRSCHASESGWFRLLSHRQRQYRRSSLPRLLRFHSKTLWLEMQTKLTKTAKMQTMPMKKAPPQALEERVVWKWKKDEENSRTRERLSMKSMKLMMLINSMTSKTFSASKSMNRSSIFRRHSDARRSHWSRKVLSSLYSMLRHECYFHSNSSHRHRGWRWLWCYLNLCWCLPYIPLEPGRS